MGEWINECLTLNPGGPWAPGKPATPGFPLFPAGPMGPGSPSSPCSPWKEKRAKEELSCSRTQAAKEAGWLEVWVVSGG